MYTEHQRHLHKCLIHKNGRLYMDLRYCVFVAGFCIFAFGYGLLLPSFPAALWFVWRGSYVTARLTVAENAWLIGSDATLRALVTFLYFDRVNFKKTNKNDLKILSFK